MHSVLFLLTDARVSYGNMVNGCTVSLQLLGCATHVWHHVRLCCASLGFSCCEQFEAGPSDSNRLHND